MKRAPILSLSLSLAVMLAAACGSNGSNGSNGNDSGVTGADTLASLPPPPPLDAGAEAGPITCGGKECKAADFLGLTTLPPCCAGDVCGVQLANAGAFTPVSNECIPLENLGVADVSCPSEPPPSSIFTTDLQGCCRPDHTCGVFVRLSSTLDLGCVSADKFVVDAGAATSCGGDAGPAAPGSD